uniref:NADH-ubiquinone oxidoreductase chain 4L n=1 Tax=Chamaemyia juncorum TaxID=1979291 RepID=A0A1W5YKC6_9MUSC|nr:NADH dehydrogenase subunit 4L [Chamaemyia juncorum]
MMSFVGWVIIVMLMISGMVMFIMVRKHLLSMLLLLEYMVLMLFMLLFIYLLFYSFSQYFSVVFLTFSVCEGSLGLSILVSLTRTHGNDYFQSFNILQC